MRGTSKQGGDSRIKDTTTVAGGTRLPKETSGGGGKGSGKPTKPKDVKLPGEKFYIL